MLSHKGDELIVCDHSDARTAAIIIAGIRREEKDLGGGAHEVGVIVGVECDASCFDLRIAAHGAVALDHLTLHLSGVDLVGARV